MEENASLFADDTGTPCDFNITNQNSVTENANDNNIPCAPKQSGIHSRSKHISVVHQQDHLLSCQLHPTFPPAWKECG